MENDEHLLHHTLDTQQSTFSHRLLQHLMSYLHITLYVSGYLQSVVYMLFYITLLFCEPPFDTLYLLVIVNCVFLGCFVLLPECHDAAAM